MILNPHLSQIHLDTLFADFNSKHKVLANYATDNSKNSNGRSERALYDNYIPQSLRLFRIRLRLAIGLKIGFNLDYALVKNEPTKETYIQISKCNEAWFSFEAMKKFCDSFGWNSTNENKYKLFSSPELENIALIDILLLTNSRIRADIYSKSKTRIDIKGYAGFLERNSTSPGLKTALGDVRDKIELGEEDLTTTDLLALAYGIRNTYVHEGVSALSGIERYKNKICLLKILYDFLILSQLKVVIHAVEHQISAHHIQYP